MDGIRVAPSDGPTAPIYFEVQASVGTEGKSSVIRDAASVRLPCPIPRGPPGTGVIVVPL